jgi:DNA repair exonuclease SbcCD nuclease subunit
MINLSGKKIACISDIHLGVHQDSQQWHSIAMKFVVWLDNTLKRNNIEDIIIAGDIFHNRHEIGVNTIHFAHTFFNVLKDYNIVAITGNHDCYYKDKSDINSVTILNNNNIQVFHELVTTKYREKSITFCPWGTNVKDIPKSDILIGHFEITNFRMNSHKICDHGLSTENLLDKASLIISGHFHYREHRTYSNNQSILYLGSPYELDFGDREQVKGISILDIETLKIEFIENNLTPKHHKILLSDLLNNKITNIPEYVKGNIISLCFDQSINLQHADELITKIQQHKPLQFRTEYNILETEKLIEDGVEQLSLDVETAIHEFVDLLQVDVDRKLILDKCLDLYRISHSTNE